MPGDPRILGRAIEIFDSDPVIPEIRFATDFIANLSETNLLELHYEAATLGEGAIEFCFGSFIGYPHDRDRAAFNLARFLRFRRFGLAQFSEYSFWN